ncbi:MAG TPA: PP2C family protein-serine/threonine phosphatase [Rubricoccaceae bacterium]|nr:PP2C family protein-serine/threonine phosphatase [Rubricoccaceae bacterium]
MPDRLRLAPADWLLGALAVLGAVLLVWRGPAEHPLSAASFALTPDGAVAAATRFVEASGYAVGEAEPVVFLASHPPLLDSLQAGLGRHEAVARLRTGATELLPAFYWLVRWRSPGEGPEDAARHVVRLTQEGVPWYFRSEPRALPGDGVDRAVLEEALGTPDAGPVAVAPGAARTDSALAALLLFDVPDGGVAGAALADTALAADRASRAAAEALGQPQPMGAAAAAAIARVHARRTLLGRWPLRVHAVHPLPEYGRTAARVFLVGAEPVLGRRPVAEVDVTAGGALLALRTRFDVDPDAFVDAPDEDGEALGAMEFRAFERPETVVRAVAYLLLGLVLLVLFVRRLRLRALDTQAALTDALVGGALVALGTGVLLPLYLVGLNLEVVQALLVVVVNGLILAVAVGLLVFAASATGDALARATWPAKTETLVLARQGAWMNRPVGAALLRGAALAVGLAGAAVGLLALLPRAALDLGGLPLYGTQMGVTGLGLTITQVGWFAAAWVPAVLLGLGMLLARARRRAWLVVPGVAAAYAVLLWLPLEANVGPMPYGWVVSGALGLVAALAFWRYDALTVGLGMIGAGVLGFAVDALVAGASPAALEGWLAVLAVAGAAAVGFVGVWRGEAAPAAYVPAYLRELAERERMEHEIEIAREVQRSFLPARMPEVEGLDLAAICLAAEEVGGDYYDVVCLDEHRLGVVVGDVSGKGIQASFYMTLVKGFLMALWQEPVPPSEVLRRLNRLFCAHVPRGVFISVLCGVFDLRARTFTFARAGHNPLLVKRAGDGVAEALLPPGLAVGLTSGRRFDETLRDQTLPLRPGDVFVFYTDGFSEAMDRHRRIYGDDRLATAVAAADTHRAAYVVGHLVATVSAYAEEHGLHDDMTMVVVRVKSPTEPAPAAAGASEAAA